MSFSDFLHRLHRRLPAHEVLFAQKWARPFAPYFDKPHYWHLGRRNVALAVAVGLFCGLMPGPTQMLSAAAAAYFVRAHLAVAVVTTFYTNPLTYLPLYFLAYELGLRVLGLPHRPLSLPEGSWPQEIGVWFAAYGKPLLAGVPLLGLIFALCGYAAVRILWRCHTVRRWRSRR